MNKDEKNSTSIIQDEWIRWLALTTTILAVFAAVSSMKGSLNATRLQISTTKESNQWQLYQAKSIKKYLMQLQQDDFKAQSMTETNAEKKVYLNKKLQSYNEKIEQYEQEEKLIKVEAENINKEQGDFKLRNIQFSNAVMLLQVAIMLSSIATLLKKNVLWYVGMIFGALGIVFMINGFTLALKFLYNI